MADVHSYTATRTLQDDLYTLDGVPLFEDRMYITLNLNRLHAAHQAS